MFAADVNDAGTVVGEATDFESERLAFIWRKHKGVRALDVSLGGDTSLAAGINRSGQIVGGSETATGTFHAFLRDVNGDVLDLGTFPDGSGSSSATAVNDRAQVVGLRGNGQITEAFLWDERHGMQSLIEDPRRSFTLSPKTSTIAVRSWARRVESRHRAHSGGRGGRDCRTSVRSTVSTRATPRPGPSTVGAPLSGASSSPAGEPHAFIWRRQTGMRDLNELIDPSSELPPQAVLGAALGINDFGSIAVIGFVPGEESQRAFLMAPQRHPGKACR